MPFTKITSGKDKGSFKSPTGKVFSPAQVKAYYASDGFKGKGMQGSFSERQKARQGYGSFTTNADKTKATKKKLGI